MDSLRKWCGRQSVENKQAASDAERCDRRSVDNKEAFLAGKRGQGGGIGPLITRRLGELQDEQPDSGDTPRRGEASGC